MKHINKYTHAALQRLWILRKEKRTGAADVLTAPVKFADRGGSEIDAPKRVLCQGRARGLHVTTTGGCGGDRRAEE